MTSSLNGELDNGSPVSQVDEDREEDPYRMRTDIWEELCPSVAETASARQDSGLQYVGEVQELQQSGGFKPMYPFQFNKKLSTMSTRQDWRTHQIAGRIPLQVRNGFVEFVFIPCATADLDLSCCVSGFPEEQLFMQNVEAGVYDGWYTGRLFSGVSKASDAAGVVVPLTPTIERDCLLLACWHTTQAEKIDRNTLSMVTAVMAPWSAFNSIHEVCLPCFHCNL